MDLIRFLLLEQEKTENLNQRLEFGPKWTASPGPLEGHSLDHILYNLRLMNEGGLIDVHISRNHIGAPAAALVLGITWKGHDFLDASRKVEIWEEIKKKVASKAISVSFDVLMQALRSEGVRLLMGTGQLSGCF